MERRFFITMIVTAFLMLSSYQVKAQTAPPAELPKFEVAADFSSLTLASRETYPGVGGRFTYNLNKHVALEAAGYFFPGAKPAGLISRAYNKAPSDAVNFTISVDSSCRSSVAALSASI